jgi:hypothetical protein
METQRKKPFQSTTSEAIGPEQTKKVRHAAASR